MLVGHHIEVARVAHRYRAGNGAVVGIGNGHIVGASVQVELILTGAAIAPYVGVGCLPACGGDPDACKEPSTFSKVVAAKLAKNADAD